MVEYNYGAMPDLQLSISVPYVFNLPAGQPRQQGFGDLEFGLKYRFLHETGSYPMAAFAPVIVAHNGNADKGLGNGGTQIFLPLWFQKSWGKWTTNAGGGYWINKAPGAINHWYFGWELQRSMGDRFTLGGEVFHESEQLPADTESESNGINIGGIYDLDPHNRLMLSFGHKISSSATQGNTFSYFGYGRTW